MFQSPTFWIALLKRQDYVLSGAARSTSGAVSLQNMDILWQICYQVEFKLVSEFVCLLYYRYGSPVVSGKRFGWRVSGRLGLIMTFPWYIAKA
jgi:hypothetical protein